MLTGHTVTEINESPQAGDIPKTVAAYIAARLQTVAARVAALCEPPWVNEYNGHLERRRLLRIWHKATQATGSQAELDTLREAVLPRLREMLNQKCHALRSKRRGKRADTRVSSLSHFLQSKKEDEIEDIWGTIVLLGGIQCWAWLQEILPEHGLTELQHRFIYRWLRELSQQKKPDPELLPLVREFEVMRASRGQSARGRSGDAARLEQMEEMLVLSFSALAVLVLYKMDAPEAVAQAHRHLEAGVVSPQLAQAAREKRDFAMLVPLARMPSGYASSDLLALWDHLRQNQPGQMPSIALEVLALLAGAPDYSLAHAPLAMLERLDEDDSFFNAHADLIVQCLESPVSHVVRFAMARLLLQPNALLDWPLVCERAGEKLWSENAGLAKEAAKFLGQVGARHQEAAPAASRVLHDALALHSLPLLKAILRALAAIKKVHPQLPDSQMHSRIEELREQQPERFGPLCDKLLKVHHAK